MKRILLSPLLLALGLAACGEAPPAAVPPQTAAVEPSPVEQPAPSPASTTPAPEPSGPYFETPAPGEELPTSKTTPGPIPVVFRHVWAIEKKDCTALPGPSRIAVAPGAIRFYEGRSVVVSSDPWLEGTLALKVDHTAEGQTTREAHTLSLSPDKKTLTYDRNGTATTYKRCD